MSAADYYAPNQQVVRGDGSGPAEEGTGSSPRVDDGTGGAPADEPDDAAELDAMTKDQLIDFAAAHGVDYPTGATKAEIRDAITGAGLG